MIALAMTERPASDLSDIESRVRFEALLADLSSEFIGLEPAAIDSTIEDALRRLVEFLDVDRAALTELNDAQDDFVFTHRWVRSGLPASYTRVAVAHVFPVAFARIVRGETHCFGRLDELPDGAPDRQALEHIGVVASATVPIVVGGRVIGSLGFGAARERHWNTEIVDRLRLMAHVFAGALARKRADAALRHAVDDRIAFESIVANVASRFVDLDSELIDDAIAESLELLVEALGIDRSTLFQASEPDGAFRVTHSWSRSSEMAIPLGEVGQESFPWSARQITDGRSIAFRNPEDLPPEATIDRQSAARFGVKSTLAVPLVVSGRSIGCLTFGTIRQERDWPAALINRLELIGQVFASALARKRSEMALRSARKENARLRARLRLENGYLQRELRDHEGPAAVITGQSAAIREVLNQIDQVAPANATVLLLGETGTGKELVARAIHERSPRRARPLVSVNCGAIPSALVESELFGREKGAYTGAVTRQIGRFELASGSTIFLDEIGELSLDIQVKFLRVLQERQIERLGAPGPIDVDVRVVSATHRDLERAVADGAFREDLYYRLNVFPIRVPPLRERVDDIPSLAWAFIEECARPLGKRIESIAKTDMAALQRYAWPGNIRELRNVIERAVILSTGPRLAIQLPDRSPGKRHHPQRMVDVERSHVLAVLEQTGWRIRGRGGAAEVLGLKPSTLESRIARLGLRAPSS